MSLLLDLGYLLAGLILSPWLFWRAAVRRGEAGRLRERLGYVKPRVGTRPCIWVHGVSLGEVLAARSLVAEIHRRLPRYEVVVSATTGTGYDAAVQQYHPQYVFRYPLDFSFVVRRTLDRLRPDAIVLMELEAWPNLVCEAARRGIPVGIANGRVTQERSMRRFGLPLVRLVARRMFSRLTWVAAQEPVYAERFGRLGVPETAVTVTGTMKYDTALVADSVEGDEKLALALGIDRGRPLWVAGSTGPGEEARLLEVHAELFRRRPELQFAVIPRRPERFDEVAGLIESRGFRCVRRSSHADLGGQDTKAMERSRRHAAYFAGRTGVAGGRTDEPSPRDQAGLNAGDTQPVVFLGDTMGELRKFYSLASVVFVGRTLVPMGGSDLMEVAGLARPVLFGPHTDNFADAAERLLEAGGGRRVRGADELAEGVAALLNDPAAARAMGEAAREVVRNNVGATRRTVDLLCASLGLRADHPSSSIATARVGS